ncbi:tetratricopeptide repeat protein, partial [Nocardia salmonicida]|uniref:tetratricopeptide repeat protein n=1 Tax=Nocardia salmonicida TaxID=53431 RepID=UPI00365A1376
DVDHYMAGATLTPYPRRGDEVAYVPRTVDQDIDRSLADRRMLLVVGPSKSGKTRTLFEAILRTLPEARLLIPERRQLWAVLENPQFHSGDETVVVWLDDLHDFLTAERPLTPAMLAHLFARPAGTVVAATLRSDALDTIGEASGAYIRDIRSILIQANTIRLASTSKDPDEQAAAAAAYPSLDLTRHGLAEMLASAPELLDLYERSERTDRPLHVILRAAVDWARIGRPDPIPEPTLVRLASGAAADLYPELEIGEESIVAAIAAARTPLENGCVAALSTTAPTPPVRAYRVFDYLVASDDSTEGGRKRRPIPESFWHAATQGADPGILTIVGKNADIRRAQTARDMLWRRAADRGEPEAMYQLGILLMVLGDDKAANSLLAGAAGLGHLEAINQFAYNLMENEDYNNAAKWFARAADAGHPDSMCGLAVLVHEADAAVAETLLRSAAESGHPIAMRCLGMLLRNQGKTSEAIDQLQRAACGGDIDGMILLAVLLHETGKPGEARQWMRTAEAAKILDRTMGLRIFSYTEYIDNQRVVQHSLIDELTLLSFGDSSNDWQLPFPAPLIDLVMNSGLAKAMHNRMAVAAARRRNHTPDVTKEEAEANAARVAELLISGPPKSPTDVHTTQRTAEPGPVNSSERIHPDSTSAVSDEVGR